MKLDGCNVQRRCHHLCCRGGRFVFAMLQSFAAVSATILHFKGGFKVFVFASFELFIL